MCDKPIKIYAVTLNCLGPSQVIGSPIKASVNLILSRYPEFIYKQAGSKFYAIDDGFINVFRHEGCSEGWKGFAGRGFDLDMEDGSKYHAYGQLWDPGCSKDFFEVLGGRFWGVGVSTPEKYRKCSVFMGLYMNKKRMIEVMGHLGHNIKAEGK